MNSKDLRNQRANVWEQMKEIPREADAENRSLNAAEKEKWDKADNDVVELSERIERMEKSEERDREMASKLVPADPKNPDGPAISADEARNKVDEYGAAFDQFVRYGIGEMNPEQRSVLNTGMQTLTGAEQRDLGVATGGVGGFLVPQAFYDRIVKAQKWVGGVRNVAFIFRTDSGAIMPVPQDNDTSNVGELLAENTVATILDTTLGSKNLSAYMYSSKIVKVGLALIQDSAFDIDSWLAKKLGIRLARIQNQHFTTGTGSSQPQGVVTGATLGKTGLVGQTTSLIYADLVDIEHSIDPAYRQGSPLGSGDFANDAGQTPSTNWMFADSTLKVLKKLLDGYARPLWQPGLAVREPDSLMGYPYVINQDMAPMAANAKSVLFGDFSNYFIREVSGVTILRLTERYADYLQVGFLAFQRCDGALIDAGTHPISYYANSAT